MIQSYIVDAFTSKRFTGNPAAICLLTKPISNGLMQSIAAEFNLSETAFLLSIEDNLWSLRWFTPVCEVNLCGHATLASAHVLLNECHLHHQAFRFKTHSGELTATVARQKIELNFPLIRTHSIEDKEFFKSIDDGFLSLHYAGEDLLLELHSEQAVKNYQPDLAAIAKLKCRGLIITAPSASSEFHFVSRFFAPAFGINEDPVTGSAHCALVDFWHKKTGRRHFVAKQVSRREGIVEVRLLGERVVLSGNSVTTAKIDLLVD